MRSEPEAMAELETQKSQVGGSDLIQVLQGQRNAAMDETASLASRLILANRDRERLASENSALQEEVTRLKAEALSHEQGTKPKPKRGAKKANGTGKEAAA